MVNLHGGLVLAKMCECADRDETPLSDTAQPTEDTAGVGPRRPSQPVRISATGFKAVMDRGWLGRLTVQESARRDRAQSCLGMDGDIRGRRGLPERIAGIDGGPAASGGALMADMESPRVTEASSRRLFWSPCEPRATSSSRSKRLRLKRRRSVGETAKRWTGRIPPWTRRRRSSK